MTHSQEFLRDKFARVGVGTTPKGLAFIETQIVGLLFGNASLLKVSKLGLML